MTTRAAPKQIFTRKRLVAGATALAVMLTVAGFVFGVFDADPCKGVKVTFVGFHNPEDGAPMLAVLLLTNGADRRLWVHELNNPSGLIFYKFISSSPTGEVVWTPPGPRGAQFVLEELYAFPVKVSLPEDGRAGRISVFCEMLPKELPPGLSHARELMWNVYYPALKEVWAVCDQEIQCPKRLPDGTVEPPRLLPVAQRQQ